MTSLESRGMPEILIIALIVSFLTTVITVPWLINKLAERGLIGVDHNKFEKPKIPEMGGLAVVIGFIAGVSTLLVINKILDKDDFPILAASLLAVVGAALTGIMDDLFGLRQRVKASIPFLFAIPIGLYVEDTTLSFIFVNPDFGVLMVLIAPFGVTCAANAGNMLEGFNGLGAGLGIIISITLIIISLLLGATDSLVLLFPLLGALVAFLWFNRYPAKIFPGDTLTLFMGATIACAAIVGDLKTIGALLFIPMIIEFFLKIRGHFQGENYGTPDEEGFLSYKGKIESLTHLIMKKRKVKERQLVWILWGIEGILCFIITIVVVLGNI
ncbi:MAG: UDP-N-acetylglucosamine--dolichyl-phosphate N-acetylglucosaminephosphotransferase [Thermoplasmata archaeon]|nr:MAG: UDP-N-acetylglucosamine--dolichyl-phosphate N-acetylglucosaminephosphotransferase [Thermoplasmata archaeon]